MPFNKFPKIKFNSEKYDSFFDYLFEGIKVERDVVVVSDCDGVLTDSKSIYSKDGKVFKVYGAYDKEAMKYLESKFDWCFQFVTVDKKGDGFEITRKRIEDMTGNQYNLSMLTAKERVEHIRKLKKYGKTVVYIGDSISDIPALSEADYAACPNNAPKELRAFVDYISELDGGNGAFADIIIELAKTIMMLLPTHHH